ALCAWYTAMANLLTKETSYFTLPVFPINNDLSTANTRSSRLV
ncbi:34029_t:CDS:1, partial [Racocetra persica]